MIKTLYSEINYGDMVELFYDTKNKKYILIINNKKQIINNNCEKCNYKIKESE